MNNSENQESEYRIDLDILKALLEEHGKEKLLKMIDDLEKDYYANDCFSTNGIGNLYE
jgi:hypothetical protein